MADVRFALRDAAAYLQDMRRAKDELDGVDFQRHLASFLGIVQTVLNRMEFEGEQRGNVGDDRLADWLVHELQPRGFPWREKQAARLRPPKRPRAWVWQTPGNRGSDPLLNLLSGERHVTVHRRAINLRQHVDVGVATSVSVSTSVTVQVTRADGTVEPPSSPVLAEPTLTAPDAETTWWRREWFFDQPPQIEVISGCEQGLAKLTTLVDAYEAQGWR